MIVLEQNFLNSFSALVSDDVFNGIPLNYLNIEHYRTNENNCKHIDFSNILEYYIERIVKHIFSRDE